jgi:hypothetical protein
MHDALNMPTNWMPHMQRKNLGVWLVIFGFNLIDRK